VGRAYRDAVVAISGPGYVCHWRSYKFGFARMASIVLMGITLLKLVLLDSITFGPVQKIVSYIVLGVLLLVISFFYQKFRQQLFNDDSSIRHPKNYHVIESLCIAE
jgi:hypothetical protein